MISVRFTILLLYLALNVTGELLAVNKIKDGKIIEFPLIIGNGRYFTKTLTQGKLFYFEQTVNNTCEYYEFQPQLYDSTTPMIALIEIYDGCELESMMLFAQRMKFVAAIIYTYSKQNLFRALWRDTKTQIPTALLSAHNGNYLRLMFLDNKNETDADVRIFSIVFNTIKVHSSDDKLAYLIPGLVFGSLVSLAVVSCCVHLVKKCIRRMTAGKETTIGITPRRTTEPTNVDLSSIQPWKRCTLAACSVHAAKFKKDHRYKMCSICLKEFEEKDKLWILPCEHEFHVDCITPWLKERRKQNCPMCRRVVIVMPD